MDMSLVSNPGMTPLLCGICSSLQKVEQPKFLRISLMTNGIVPPYSRLLSSHVPSLYQTAQVITKLNTNLYVKPRRLPHGSFHASVISPGGNNAETFALAIDQLRLLRNVFGHSSSSKMDKPTFDQHIQYTKDAIGALGVTTDPVDAVGSLTEADFPTQRVRTLEDEIRKELEAESEFLKEDVKDELVGIRSDIAQLNQERKEDVTRAARDRREEIQELKNQLREDLRKEHQAQRTTLKEELKDDLTRIGSDIAQSSQELKEDVTRAVRERREEIRELHHQLKEDIRKEHQAESALLKEDVKDELIGIRAEIVQSNQELKEGVTRASGERKEDIQELHYQLKEDIKKELQEESTLLKEDVKEELKNIRSDITKSNQERKEDVTLAARERKEEIQELKDKLELHTEQWKEETLASGKTTVETTSAADHEINEKVAELNRKFDEVLKDKRLLGTNNC